MKKLFSAILVIAAILTLAVSFTACSGGALEMSEIEARLAELSKAGKIFVKQTGPSDSAIWTENINRELTERYGKPKLAGSVVSVFGTDDETYFLEFESEADANSAKEALAYRESKGGYDNWYISVRGKTVLFGERKTIDLVLNIKTVDPNVSSPSASASEGLSIELDESGEFCIVTGIGACTDEKIVVPSEFEGVPVRVIGSEAFEDCSIFTEMVLPSTVTEIRSSAFYNCSIERIIFSDSLKRIESYAFRGSSLKRVHLPESLEYLGKCAFLSCAELESAVIPGTVGSVSNSCFSNCENLSGIQIGEGITEIEAGAFYNCDSLHQVILPESLKKLDGFEDCDGIGSITIPKGVTFVHGFTFKDCGSLRFVYNYSSVNVKQHFLNPDIGVGACTVIDMI